jgi:hypothetical protein
MGLSNRSVTICNLTYSSLDHESTIKKTQRLKTTDQLNDLITVIRNPKIDRMRRNRLNHDEQSIELGSGDTQSYSYEDSSLDFQIREAEQEMESEHESIKI